ncbi:MAG: helix-turn-helix domain-containing protein, partial [Spirochaetales bacterium]|nr:helix-turn-helix domain-containing protein [Spirochaetales bacterium]
MESVGTLLKTARESRAYSIEQVARETNIAKRYLEALEEEDLSVFPGETYFIGFLRNYGEFLGQDPQALVELFRNQQIQEQAAPIEELLKPRGWSKLPWILAAVFLGAAALVWFM